VLFLIHGVVVITAKKLTCINHFNFRFISCFIFVVITALLVGRSS